MKANTTSRKGLSTVITTLIILVVAVLLAGVVTYYATNVVMIRTIQEDVRIRKPHIWVQEGDHAYAALNVQNLGGRDILIDKITVRGVVCPWGEGTATSQVIGTGAATVVTFVDILTNLPVIEGSVSVTDGVETFSDDGAGVLTSDLTGTGTIDYVTGDISVTFYTEPTAGVDITASYSYTVEGAVSVKYYRVKSGQDVSGDFVLKELAGEVYAQIGTVPAQGDWESAPSDMPLKSSGSMLFFIKNPTNIALNDVGTTISLTVYTTNAQWIVETIVQAAEIESTT